MKLCKDCKHMDLSDDWSSQEYKLKYANCAHPSVMSLVDGSGVVSCKSQRKFKLFDRSTCGPDGRLFEPKEAKVKV